MSQVFDLLSCLFKPRDSRSDHHGHASRIQRLRDKLPEREIAHMTGLSRNTALIWLRASTTEAPKYRREVRLESLSVLEAVLKQA